MPFPTFSGGTIQPGQVSYEAISTGTDLTLTWPAFSPASGTVVALIMDITATAGGLSILLPAANQAGVGSAMVINNVGSNQFTVKDNASGVITTVAAGAIKYIYLKTNTTVAGSWFAFTFGTGTSAADAAALAGFGLKAITTTLNQEHQVATDTTDRTITTNDRAKLYVWTSGTVTATLPLAATAGAGFFWLAKSMPGVSVTIARAGADTIDGVTSVTITGGSGAIIYTNGTAWYTIGTTSSAFSSLGIGNGSMSAPSLFFTSETNTGIYRPGAGLLAITAGGKDAMRFNAVGSAVNAIDVFPSVTGSAPYLKAYGTDTNVDLGLRPQGTLGRSILQDGAGNEVVIADVQTASAVNEVTVTNAATGNKPVIKASGGDPNVGLALRPKGSTGTVTLQDGNGNAVLVADVATSTAVNQVTITNSATGVPPKITATGTDTNIGLRLSPKGTGTFQFTDGTDITKVVAHSASAVTTGTTRTATWPDANTSIPIFSTTTTVASVTTKGDLWVATAADTVARVGVGQNGQAVYADSSQTSGLVYLDNPSRPNVLINPNWQIDQINEGALYTVNATSVNGPDGWSGDTVGAGVFKLRTLADPDNAALKCLEITCTTADASIAATDRYEIWTTVEGYDAAAFMLGTAAAIPFTVQFKLKINVTGTYGVYFSNSAANRFYAGTITVANTNENEYSISLTGDTTGTWLYTNGIGLRMGLVLSAGSNFQGTAGAWTGSTVKTTSAQANFMSNTANIGYLKRISFHQGALVQAYKPADIQKELAKAQRYYSKSYDQGTTAGTVTTNGMRRTQNFAVSGNAVNVDFVFPVTMRAAPTTTYYSDALATASRLTDGAGTAQVASQAAAGMTSTSGQISAGTLTGAQGHYTANARLS